MATFKPSPEQTAIFNECQNGDGHLVIEAKAGVGKTTTIIAALAFFCAKLSILLCAFNRKIAKELSSRIQVPNATARTLHQIGLECIKRFVRGVRIESDNERGNRGRYLANSVCDRSVPDDVFSLVVKLCGLARETVPLAASGADLVELAYDHECVPDAEWEAEGFTAEFVADKAYRAMLVAAEEPEYIVRGDHSW